MKSVPRTDFLKLKKSVIDRDLCCRCDMCIEACPVRVIGIGGRKDHYKPFATEGCISCGDCYAACPGKEFDFSGISAAIFDRTDSNRFIGSYRSIHMAYANDETVRNAGASGGIVTALLIFMLKKSLIDGASIITCDKSKPWIFMRKIAETEGEIKSAAQSKYTLSQVIDKNSNICNYKGRVAFVGLPCQVQALRKYESARGKALGNVKFYIALYCGTQLYPEATESLLKRFGIVNYDDIKSLEYRHGPWPGKFRVALRSGNEFAVNRIAFNYLNLFYKVGRCLTCIDLTGEFADISVGDGWMREKDVSGGGYSVVIARSEQGESLIEDAKGQGYIKADPIGREDAVGMHSHLLDDKKNGAFIRMRLLRLFGMDVPDYGMNFPRVSARKGISGFIMMVIYAIGSLKISRFAVNLVPVNLMEKILDNTRTAWMASSRKKILKEEPEVK